MRPVPARRRAYPVRGTVPNAVIALSMPRTVSLRAASRAIGSSACASSSRPKPSSPGANVNDRERDNQIHRARVLEVRIHLPPAERVKQTIGSSAVEPTSLILGRSVEPALRLIRSRRSRRQEACSRCATTIRSHGSGRGCIGSTLCEPPMRRMARIALGFAIVLAAFTGPLSGLKAGEARKRRDAHAGSWCRH